MKVNMVMLVKDRERLTQQAIGSLYDTTDNLLFNLTVVDDGSKQSPMEFIPEVHADNCTTLRIEDSKGITGQARNLGVYWAEKYWGRGDYLYLTDNDMYFTPGWLEKLLEAWEKVEKYGVAVLGAWNHPYLKPTEVQPPLYSDLVSLHDAVTGASQLMQWKTWDENGPLDAHAAGVGQSEDWKFCRDAHDKNGWLGSIQPHVVLNCGLTNSLGAQSPGATEMLAELEKSKITYPNLMWE